MQVQRDLITNVVVLLSPMLVMGDRIYILKWTGMGPHPAEGIPVEWRR